ncbi:Nn.00g070050.m01.CDS01 [Neocucurbitaria sp. VM-36]
MEIEAPTFHSLNKPQKRALILRDQLRYTDPRHLDTFIEGIAHDEPPTYRKVNGTIAPPLALVTLKPTATRFDLGNVLFPDENNAVHRVYFTVEDGRFEMRTGDALPINDADLNSVPIHGFIAGGMLPMFKEKFQAIFARKNKINDARRVAYNIPNQPLARFYEGETLARLDFVRAEQKGGSSQVKKLGKRKPGEAVVKHVSNKRTRTGLDNIPNDVKSATFNTIPENVKVDLFNTIVKTAFPNFDNLMTACWNVVSVYSNLGSDFPDLHRSIVDLKHVLLEFDESSVMCKDRTDPKYRSDYQRASASGTNGHLAPASILAAIKDRSSAAGQAGDQGMIEMSEERENSIAATNGQDNITPQSQQSMPPPPRILQVTPHPEVDREEEPSSLDVQSSARDGSHGDSPRPSSRQMSEKQTSGSVPSSARSSPTKQSSELLHDRVQKVRDQTSGVSTSSREKSLEQSTSLELARRREEYAASIGKANLHSAGTAKSLYAESTAADEHDQAHHPPYHQATSNIKKGKQSNITSFIGYTIPQLRKMLHERKAALIRTYGSLNNISQQDYKQLKLLEATIRAREHEDMDDDRSERERRTPSGSGDVRLVGDFLGKSMLGTKKPTAGKAPVAPMLHVRKEGGGGGNGGAKDGAGSGPRRG